MSETWCPTAEEELDLSFRYRAVINTDTENHHALQQLRSSSHYKPTNIFSPWSLKPLRTGRREQLLPWCLWRADSRSDGRRTPFGSSSLRGLAAPQVLSAAPDLCASSCLLSQLRLVAAAPPLADWHNPGREPEPPTRLPPAECKWAAGSHVAVWFEPPKGDVLVGAGCGDVMVGGSGGDETLERWNDGLCSPQCCSS